MGRGRKLDQFLNTYHASLLHQVSALLTNAQVKALPITAVDIIGAPGEARGLYPLSALFYMDAEAGAYGNTDANTRIYLANSGAGIALAAMNASLLTFAAKRRGYMGIDSFEAPGTAGVTETIGSANFSANNSLQLLGDNAGGAFSGGNDANELAVVVLFLVFDDELRKFLSPIESGWHEATREF